MNDPSSIKPEEVKSVEVNGNKASIEEMKKENINSVINPEKIETGKDVKIEVSSRIIKLACTSKQRSIRRK